MKSRSHEIGSLNYRNGSSAVEDGINYVLSCATLAMVYVRTNILIWDGYHSDGLVQDCSDSIANALELLQSCAKPYIWYAHGLLYITQSKLAKGKLYNSILLIGSVEGEIFDNMSVKPMGAWDTGLHIYVTTS